MAYHIYTSAIKQILSQIEKPTLLEIGIDRGQMFIPLSVFLARSKKEFALVGVDVFVQDSLQVTLGGIDFEQGQNIQLVQGNSLEFLPRLVELNSKFNIVLLDGDHNYHTVSKELTYLESITYENSLVICDDYNGRWSEKDQWYAEVKGYEYVEHTTKKVDTEKHGVKTAIDEFVSKNSNWKIHQPVNSESIILLRS